MQQLPPQSQLEEEAEVTSVSKSQDDAVGSRIIGREDQQVQNTAQNEDDVRIQNQVNQYLLPSPEKPNMKEDLNTQQEETKEQPSMFTGQAGVYGGLFFTEDDEAPTSTNAPSIAQHHPMGGLPTYTPGGVLPPPFQPPPFHATSPNPGGFSVTQGPGGPMPQQRPPTYAPNLKGTETSATLAAAAAVTLYSQQANRQRPVGYQGYVRVPYSQAYLNSNVKSQPPPPPPPPPPPGAPMLSYGQKMSPGAGEFTSQNRMPQPHQLPPTTIPSPSSGASQRKPPAGLNRNAPAFAVPSSTMTTSVYDPMKGGIPLEKEKEGHQEEETGHQPPSTQPHATELQEGADEQSELPKKSKLNVHARAFTPGGVIGAGAFVSMPQYGNAPPSMVNSILQQLSNPPMMRENTNANTRRTGYGASKVDAESFFAETSNKATATTQQTTSMGTKNTAGHENEAEGDGVFSQLSLQGVRANMPKPKPAKWMKTEFYGAVTSVPEPMEPVNAPDLTTTHVHSSVWHPPENSELSFHLYYYHCFHCTHEVEVGKKLNRPPDLKLGGVCGDVPSQCIARLLFNITGIKIKSIDMFGRNFGRCNLWLDDEKQVPIFIQLIDRRMWMAPLCHGYAVVVNDEDAREHLYWYLEGLKQHGPHQVRFPRHLVRAERWTYLSERDLQKMGYSQ